MVPLDVQQPLILAAGDVFGRAVLFRFSREEWEREKESLGAFLNKVKEHNASGLVCHLS